MILYLKLRKMAKREQLVRNCERLKMVGEYLIDSNEYNNRRLLLARKTYDIFAVNWPEINPIVAVIE